jgi:adenylate kinase family enzyme
MQSTTSRKTIDVKLKDKTESMSLETYSRWLCLIEAIELVCSKAKQMKIDTANNIDWIKPLAFQKYIDERHESMVDEVNMYEKQEDITPLQPANTICNTQQEPLLK